MNQTANIGIIGTGGMGGRHARNLSHEIGQANVVALMDMDTERAQQVADMCGGATIYTDAKLLIADPNVDAVLIAAPDRFHAELAHACIEAKKPVLCEKPLATSAAEALKVIEAEVTLGKRLVQLGFMREYDPAHIAVKEIGDRGELGEKLVFRGVHINPSKDEPRPIDDVITNSAIHDIHSARWMMGDEIERVYTTYIPASPSQPETARFVMIQLHFRSGALGVIECNSEAGYGYEVEVKLTGETGSVQTNTQQGAIVRHNNLVSQQVDEDWLLRFDTAYVNETRAWVQSIINEIPTGPSAWDGYASMVVADACIESAKSGQPVDVHLPERPHLYGRTTS